MFVPILLNDMLKGRSKRLSDMNKPNEKAITTGTGTVIIVNPSSSSGSTGKNWDDLYLKIKEIFGENPEVAFTKKSGDGTILARAFLEKGVKNIIAIGGDGTINEVANGFFVFQEDDDNDNNNPDITPITATAFPEPPTFRQINPNAVLRYRSIWNEKCIN